MRILFVMAVALATMSCGVPVEDATIPRQTISEFHVRDAKTGKCIKVHGGDQAYFSLDQDSACRSVR